MNKLGLILWSMSLLCSLGGCKRPEAHARSSGRRDPEEHYSANERETAAKLQPVKDAIMEESEAFQKTASQLFTARRFDDLEDIAKASRTGKQVLGNGLWRIGLFHTSLEVGDGAPERTWQTFEGIHRDWIAARPESITARVAYAKFLTDYAWHARGSGFADEVTEEGWRLFRERLAAARKVLGEARTLPEKDPVLWSIALLVAMGENWSKPEFEVLVAEATASEPKFWGYDASRAYSLLPRWQGNPGDWEAYAAEAAARPQGLGAETYTRIVIRLRGFYDNIFRDTQVSWPKTREGLQLMRERYPDSLEVLSHCAMLGTMAADRDFAKEAFRQLGDRYVPGVWRKPERMAHYRKWTETGTW